MNPIGNSHRKQRQLLIMHFFHQINFKLFHFPFSPSSSISSLYFYLTIFLCFSLVYHTLSLFISLSVYLQSIYLTLFANLSFYFYFALFFCWIPISFWIFSLFNFFIAARSFFLLQFDYFKCLSHFLWIYVLIKKIAPRVFEADMINIFHYVTRNIFVS